MSAENQPESEGKKPDGRKRNGKPKGDRGNVNLCGAKTKRGTPCRAIGMSNGRCRIHGGKSTGPSMEGRMALSEAKVKTGERQRIYFNYLREDEQVENRIPYDAKLIVEDEIFLIEIRQKRIMERIHQIEIMKVEDPDIEYIKEPKKTGENPEVDPDTGQMEWKPVYAMRDVQQNIKHTARTTSLLALEEALTRVTALKGKMIELREKIQTKTIGEEDGSLAMLTKIIGEARSRYDGPRAPGATVVEGEYTEVK